MAKIENTKMTVSLDNDSKRIIRNLTKAIDRLSRNMRPFEVKPGDTRRLTEPAGDLEPGEEQLRQPVTLSAETVRKIIEVTGKSNLCDND